jgi:abhydrolase domain-containing protein 14
MNLISVPSLIVFGINDPLHKSTLRTLEKIPNHKTVMIPDAGHACYVDNPEVWHEELSTFLESL